MIAALVLAAALSVATPPSPASQEAVRERLAACGIPRGAVTVRYEPEVQADVVTIAAGGEAPDERSLSCVAELSIDAQPFVHFLDPAVDARFRAVQVSSLQRFAQDIAREWFRERGQLAQLPAFDPERESLAAFAERLEAFCGIAPRTVLVAGEGVLEYLGGDRLPRSLPDESFSCMVHAVAAADLGRYGLTFGFTGNGVAEGEEAD